jgi:hypothetical protein
MMFSLTSSSKQWSNHKLNYQYCEPKWIIPSFTFLCLVFWQWWTLTQDLLLI